MKLDKNKKYGYRSHVKHRLISSSREKGEYGSWKEEYDVSVQNRVSKVIQYPSVVSSFDFEPGEMAYLITVVYSSGDSFGKSTNGSYEDIWLFKNPKVAMDFKRHILSVEKTRTWKDTPQTKDYHYRNDEEDFVYEPNDIPWNHYFERFEECLLTMVMVEPDFDEI